MAENTQPHLSTEEAQWLEQYITKAGLDPKNEDHVLVAKQSLADVIELSKNPEQMQQVAAELGVDVPSYEQQTNQLVKKEEDLKKKSVVRGWINLAIAVGALVGSVVLTRKYITNKWKNGFAKFAAAAGIGLAGGTAAAAGGAAILKKPIDNQLAQVDIEASTLANRFQEELAQRIMYYRLDELQQMRAAEQEQIAAQQQVQQQQVSQPQPSDKEQEQQYYQQVSRSEGVSREIHEAQEPGELKEPKEPARQYTDNVTQPSSAAGYGKMIQQQAETAAKRTAVMGG